MIKLFARESDDNDLFISDDVAHLDGMPPAVELLECEEDISMALEGSETALARVKALDGIRGMLCAKKIASEGYFATLSCFNAVAGKGYKFAADGIPAMEDYTNTFSAKASHQIAMEGIGEYIKKAYDAIKAFLKAFFKKIGEFFKRMLGMDMELKSYEDSLQAFISKLKKYNATNDKPAMVSSKLPSMLAQPGMNEVDSDYILNHGVKKMSMLMDVMIRGGFGDRSPFARGGQFDSFETVVKSLYNNVSKMSVETLTTTDAALRAAVSDLLLSHFHVKNLQYTDLPHSVMEKVSAVYDRPQLSGGQTSYMSMSDPTNHSTSLPAGANVFLAHQDNTNFFICSIVEPAEDVSSNVPGIGQLSNLDALYTFYKTAVKSVDAKVADKYLDNVHDRLTKMMELITKQATSYLADAEVNLTPPPPKRNPEGNDMYADLPQEVDKRPAIVKALTNYLLDFVSALQQLIKSIVSAFYNTYVKLRYELIKYIYNSAQQFAY